MKPVVNLRHLQAFVEVARNSSFTRAAERLLVSQSALTVTVRQLEEELGIALFNRTTRSVALTADGEVFLGHAERLLNDFDSTMRAMRQTAKQRRGQVSIAVVPSVATRFMPALLKGFGAAYPDVRVVLHDDNGRGVQRQVIERRAEFGIGSIWKRDPELEFVPLTADRFGLVCRRDDKLAGGEGPVTWSSIDPQRLFVMASDTGVYTTLMATPEFIQRCPAPAGEVLAMVTLIDMVRAGLGMTLLPELARPAAVETELTFRPLTNPPVMRHLYLIRRRGETLSPSARRAWDYLLAQTPQEIGSVIA